MYVNEFIALIFSCMMLILIIKQCLIRKRILKVRLMFSSIITFLIVLIIFFNDEIASTSISDYLDYILLGIITFIGLLFLIYSESSQSKEQFNRDLFKTLDDTKYYVLVDKKNRVKEISSLFLKDLEVSFEEAYKENLFNLIEKKYRIFKLNDQNVDKKDLNIYYSNPNNTSSQMNLEIHDDKGDISAYYFNETKIMTYGRFKGRIFIGDKKNSENLVGMEKNLAKNTEELDIIKSRFITILEKTKEGIFFADLTNKTIWLNDIMKHDLCLNDNNMSLDTFLNNIHPDDLAMYKAKLAAVNNINPRYSVSYRYNIGSRYAYVKEEGNRISNGKQVELCGVMRLLDNYRFERTQTELDAIMGEAEMLSAINQLYKHEKTFEVVHIRMANIPQINEQYGRSIGNMAMSEYIKIIKNNFVDANLIYRISGLDFIAVIIDYRKMEQLKNSLINNEKLLHINAEYGSMKVKIDVFMGIAYSSEAKDAKDIIIKTNDTLRFCSNPQYTASYAYYKDIR